MTWQYKSCGTSYLVICDGTLEATVRTEKVAAFLVRAMEMNEEWKQKNPDYGRLN